MALKVLADLSANIRECSPNKTRKFADLSANIRECSSNKTRKFADLSANIRECSRMFAAFASIRCENGSPIFANVRLVEVWKGFAGSKMSCISMRNESEETISLFKFNLNFPILNFVRFWLCVIFFLISKSVLIVCRKILHYCRILRIRMRHFFLCFPKVFW